jgi:hypothetical protein
VVEFGTGNFLAIVCHHRSTARNFLCQGRTLTPANRSATPSYLAHVFLLTTRLDGAFIPRSPLVTSLYILEQIQHALSSHWMYGLALSLAKTTLRPIKGCRTAKWEPFD